MELTIRRELTVKPALPTWRGTQSLSEFDQTGSMDYPCVLYFYRLPAEKRFDDIIDALVDSLSRALVRFYPLAGRLRRTGGGRFELLCSGQGVGFAAAEINATLDSFGDYTAPSEDVDKFLQPEIGNSLGMGPEETPLFFSRVTRFRCGGLSLSMATSHVIADGMSGQMFVSEWARLARGESVLPRAPVLFGTFPTARTGSDHSEDLYRLPALLNEPGGSEGPTARTAMVSLRLTRGQVERLREMANHGANGLHRRGFSRYESIAAHVWKCSSKARRHVAGQPTACLVTVDAGRRVKPQLPPGFFGNAVFDVAARCLAGDLVSGPLGFGAARIRAAIEGVTSDYVSSVVGFLRSEPDLAKYQFPCASLANEGLLLDGNPNVNVVSYADIPLLGIDFGWGKEIHFGVGYQRADGDSIILRSPNGDGSLVVVMCLADEHVESFKKHFYGDILF